MNEKRTSKLWLINTSHYCLEQVWPLIECALESEVRHAKTKHPIKVHLTNCSDAYCGRAYWQERHAINPQNIYAGHVTWRRILCRIGRPEKFPVNARYAGHRRRDMPEYKVNDWREGIVHIVAHEMAHAFGAGSGYDGEFKCEMSSIDALEHYRKNKSRFCMEVTPVLIALLAAEDRPATASDRIELANASLKNWQRKARLAATKVERYQREVNRLTRGLDRYGVRA